MTGPADPLALIETLPLAVAMRDSLWLHAAVGIAHIVGFVTLVGSAAMLDLRLLGLSRNISVVALSRHTLTWSLGALLVIVPSGLLLFTAHGNALWFRAGPYQDVKNWDTGAGVPLQARLSAGLSLLLWVAVISCGRLLVRPG